MLTSYCFEKTKTGHLEQKSKNHETPQQASETSLEEYKYSYFDSYTQKQLLQLQIRKKHILQYYRWVVYETPYRT